MRVLLIIPDHGTARLCEIILSGLNCQFASVDDAASGMAEIEQQCPDLALLDDRVSDVPAADVLTWMGERPAARRVPIVLMVGNRYDPLRERVLPDALLVRPIMARDFAGVLRPYADSDIVAGIEHFSATGRLPYRPLFVRR